MTDGGSSDVQLFPTVAQEILDEFALSYSIDPIYRMMMYVVGLVDGPGLMVWMGKVGEW